MPDIILGLLGLGEIYQTRQKFFVKSCLRKIPDDRWTVKQALDFVNVIWIPELIKNNELRASLTEPVKVTDIDDIKRFCEYGEMKKTILITIAKTMDRGELSKLRQIFLSADTENTGTLNFSELQKSLQQLHPDMTDEEIRKIFSAIDYDKSGNIHYDEFLAALAESEGLLTMNRLAEAFDRIDAEGKGYISRDDLRMILGKDSNEEVVEKMMKEADFDGNGQIVSCLLDSFVLEIMVLSFHGPL